MQTITVGSTHTPEMMAHEMDAILGDTDIILSLGALIRLHQIHSPFLINGGEIMMDDLFKACDILNISLSNDPAEQSKDIINEISSAWRIWEIIVPREDKDNDESKYSDFDPEWAVDIIAAAADALPSLTWHQAVEEFPLSRLLHLACSSIRRNGGRTQRPPDMEAAFEKLREIQNERRSQSDNQRGFQSTQSGTG